VNAETETPNAPEVTVLVPVPFGSSRAAACVWLGVVAIGATCCALVWPSFALRYVLPMAAFAASVLVRVVCMRPSASVVRFDARGYTSETRGIEGHSPWSDVTRIVDDAQALVVQSVQGIPLRIPWSSKPDLRAILALAPKSVVFQSRAATPNKRRFGWTLGLWIFLIVIMMAIYSLIAQEPPP
jgi:hypothetical protein